MSETLLNTDRQRDTFSRFVKPKEQVWKFCETTCHWVLLFFRFRGRYFFSFSGRVVSSSWRLPRNPSSSLILHGFAAHNFSIRTCPGSYCPWSRFVSFSSPRALVHAVNHKRHRHHPSSHLQFGRSHPHIVPTTYPFLSSPGHLQPYLLCRPLLPSFQFTASRPPLPLSETLFPIKCRDDASHFAEVLLWRASHEALLCFSGGAATSPTTAIGGRSGSVLWQWKEEHPAIDGGEN
jgi:hypothetical protein